MKAIRLGTLFLLLSNSAFALNDLGSLDDARKNHPAIFVSGNVLEYTINKINGYVYNGEAKQMFEGVGRNGDAQLYRKAELDAKANLCKFLTKNDTTLSVQMSGSRKLYEFVEGKMRRVILFVAKQDVSVIKKEVGVFPRRADDRKKTIETTPPASIAQCNDALTNSAAQKKDPEIVAVVAKDRLAECLERIAKDHTDCIAMSMAAEIYSSRGATSDARNLYAKIVDRVAADESMDKEYAASLLLAAAEFEQKAGNGELALKYYRLIIRCDGLRRWRLTEEIEEANKNISLLLLKAF